MSAIERVERGDAMPNAPPHPGGGRVDFAGV